MSKVKKKKRVVQNIKLITGILFAVVLLLGFKVNHAFAATEFVSIVDTGSGSGYDFSSLSSWESVMTNTTTDLTSANTKVFSGTVTSSISDNTTVYQCRSGTYQSVSGTMIYDSVAGQALVKSITAGASFSVSDRWYTNNTCNSSGYFTISNTGDSAIAVAKCRSTTGAADTTDVTIDGWTTSAANYIKIWTDPSEGYRHKGVWNTAYYHLQITDQYGGAIQVKEEYVRIDGLQIYISGTINGDERVGIYANGGTGPSDLRFSNNLIRGISTNYSFHCGIGRYTAGSGSMSIWNNIIYDFQGAGGYNSGIYLEDADFTDYIYNNTIVSNNYGIYNNKGGGNMIAKNNLIKGSGNTNTYVGTFASGTDYNATDGTDDIGQGSNNKTSISTTNLFANEAGDDFHLTSSTTSDVRNAGTNLSADSNLPFSTDIDSQARPIGGAWDIGADEEGPKTVYYSVGQDASTNNMTGTPTVTISGGVATFSTAQTGNIGVGDRITYNTSSIAYISGKISGTQWYVVTNTGLMPTDISNSTVVSIKREYTTLSGAEAGATDSNHLNTTDLVANNYQLNFPCYYDTGADTTAVTVDGYTTGSSNYIKIYTPNNTSTEVNNSQRHSGKWSDSKYRMVVNTGDNAGAIDFSDDYIVVDGLQFSVSGTSYPGGIWGKTATATTNLYQVSNCLFTMSGAVGHPRGITSYDADANWKIWNNIFYDFWIDVDHYPIPIIMRYASTSYIYNNTIQNSWTGIDVHSTDGGVAHVVNNIIQDSLAGDNFSGTFASDSGYNATDVFSAEALFGQNESGVAASGTGGTTLIISGKSFLSTVKTGMIVTDLSTYGGYVSSVDSDTQLTLTSLAGSLSVGTTYYIYRNMYGEVSFLDESNDDFHLAPSDTAARNKGANLYSDSNLPITSDIDGESRSSAMAFDIGADETVQEIYRSVAPDADGSMSAIDDDNSQADTLSITTAGAATFEVAVDDIVGVGDALVFDDDADNDLDANDTILFIHSRTDSTHFAVRTENGGWPAAATTDNDKWAIYRAYTSLSNAEAGTKNTAIPISFTGGNRDLVANNEQWNIACYANGTTADTTAVTIDGWTTGEDNYLKVYTPVGSNEVGTSQRHEGKWEDGKYRLSASGWTSGIKVDDENVRIEGLQVEVTGASYQDWGIIHYESAINYNAYLLKNIIRSDAGTLNYKYGIKIDSPGSSSRFFVYNNIIYDIGDGQLSAQANVHLGYSGTTIKSYFYNNTIYGGYFGFYPVDDNTYAVVKNNILQNITTSGFGDVNDYDPSSDYNLTNTDDAPGANSKNSTTVAFLDEANDDFHLAVTDTAAKDAGAVLCGDANLPVTHDIDGEQRICEANKFDIGADETTGPPPSAGGGGVINLGTNVNLGTGVSLKAPMPDMGFVGSKATPDNVSTPNYDYSDHGLASVYECSDGGQVSYVHCSCNSLSAGTGVNAALLDASTGAVLRDGSVTTGFGTGVVTIKLDNPYTIELGVDYGIAIGHDTPYDWWTVDSINIVGSNILEDDAWEITNTLPTHDLGVKSANYILRCWADGSPTGD